MRFRIWLEARDVVRIGQVIEIPGRDNRNPFHVQVIKVQGNEVWLRQISPGKPAPIEDDMAGGNPFKMTLDALKHYANDLTGKVKVRGKTNNPWIDKVLNGEATYLGKGDDGIAFDAGHMIVKVSSSVPYHPDSQHQRTPDAAAQNMIANTRLTEMLRKQGVPGILPTYVKLVGNKAFQVRPKVEIKKTYSREEMKEVQNSLEAMHRAGYSVNDELQVGVYKGRMYHFDLGKLSKISHPEDAKEDMNRLDTLMGKSGIDRPEKRWEYLIGMLTNWYTDWDKDGKRKQYIQKLIQQKIKMDKAYPERKAETEEEFRKVVDAI